MDQSQENQLTPGQGLPSAVLFEDRVTFDFELLLRPQPTDSYYTRNTKEAIPAKIRAASFEEAERLALSAIGPCIRNHQWEVSLVRFDSSNNPLSSRPREQLSATEG